MYFQKDYCIHLRKCDHIGYNAYTSVVSSHAVVLRVQKQGFKKRMSRGLKTINEVICPVQGCGKMFRENGVSQHVRQSHDEQDYKEYKESTGMSENLGSFHCSVQDCERVFQSSKGLGQHFKRAHNRVEESEFHSPAKQRATEEARKKTIQTLTDDLWRLKTENNISRSCLDRIISLMQTSMELGKKLRAENTWIPDSRTVVRSLEKHNVKVIETKFNIQVKKKTFTIAFKHLDIREQLRSLL